MEKKGVYVGGSSGECIYQSVELAKHAESLGVDAIAAIPPIYFRLPEYAIADYWNAMSAAAPNTDFIIYNIPQLAGVALTQSLYSEMRKNPRVIGVKNSSMPVQDIQMFKAAAKEDYIIFNGPDEQFISGRVIGAEGGIGGTYGVMPELFLKMDELVKANKLEEAKGKLFVSEATLSRFAKKCGFRGYRDFIYQYEEGFVEKAEPVTGNTRMVLNAYQELLNKTYSLVDERQILRISRYISQAGRVFACGIGSSGLAAREVESRFMRIGIDINALTDSDVIRMQGVFQNPSCLVLGISLSGEKEEILYLLQEAHKRGAKTVLITAKNKQQFDSFCDEVILIPSLLYLNHGNLISPQFPILVMMDILYLYCLGENKFVKETLHEHTVKALKGQSNENQFPLA